MDLNASFIKDKIKDLNGENDVRMTDYQKIWSVGGSQYEFYMPTWAGVDPDNGNPGIRLMTMEHVPLPLFIVKQLMRDKDDQLRWLMVVL